MKLRIRRNRSRWVLEQGVYLAEYASTFRKACAIAAQWKREGWYVS